jgi:hypothetical protein
VSADHDPARVALLLTRTRAAIAELRELRCADVAAAEALGAARLAALTLETLWIPALAVLSGTADSGERR